MADKPEIPLMRSSDRVDQIKIEGRSFSVPSAVLNFYRNQIFELRQRIQRLEGRAEKSKAKRRGVQ